MNNIARAICPPERVLHDWERYAPGTPEDKFVVDFVVQQELLAGQRHWEACW